MQGLTARIAQARAAQRLRTRQVVTTQRLERAQNFSSNDYLGLAQHPLVIAACQQAAEQYGVGGESSCLVAGYTDLHRDFELAFAEFVSRPAALLYSTGYMANLGVISVLAHAQLVLADKLIHASLVDAIQLAQAKLLRYPHRDYTRLQQLITQPTTQAALLVTDSVFSMHGDLADLPRLAALAQQRGTTLLVDDAHGIGVLGARGAGACEHFNLGVADVPVLISPLAKAFGVMGAMVTGSKELIEGLIQFSRPYAYTSALPPAITAAGLASLNIIQAESWRREKLQSLIHYTQQRAADFCLPLAPSASPIQPIRVSTSAHALWLSEQLQQQGYLLKAMRPPTVPPRDICLRLSLTALHEPAHIDALFTALRRLCDAMPR